MHRTRRVSPAVLAGLAVAFGAAFARANDPAAEALSRQAADLEAQGQWERACEAYDQALACDRTRRDARERYAVCLRHAQLQARCRDGSLGDQVLARDLGFMLRLYGEVLARLRDSYVDGDRARPSLLFAYGLDGLRLALDDEAFRHAYVTAATPQAVRAFRDGLAVRWAGAEVADLVAARERAADVAAAARREIGLRPEVTVLELACGACAGLDEFTLWLTPGQLADEYAGLEGGAAAPSVLAAQVFKDHPGVGYLQLTGFQQTTPHEFDEAVLQLKAQGMRALVLDLRGNPGGLFPAAVQIAERFLADGVIVTTRARVRDQNRAYRAAGPAALTMPLVVLVDGDTASAAEVVAGALKDNGRALVVGQPTFGKGCIQEVVPLEVSAGGLRVTLARFYSPRGQAYTGRGVAPHLVIERSPLSASDTQLEAAVQAAQMTLAGQ